jgi:hypothetical protein
MREQLEEKEAIRRRRMRRRRSAAATPVGARAGARLSYI